MKKVNVVKTNEIAREIRGNERWGNDLYVTSPYENGLMVTHREREDFRDEWKIEIEYEIKDKIWKEIESHGAALENIEEKLFIHSDALKRKLTATEMKFLNSYRNRFLLIQEDEQTYIYDNEDQKQYKIPDTRDFKEFKENLKDLGLI